MTRGSGCPKTGTIPPLHLFVATIPLLLILFLIWRSQEEAEERKMQFHILCRSPEGGHQLGGCCSSSTVFVLDWRAKSVSASSSSPCVFLFYRFYYHPVSGTFPRLSHPGTLGQRGSCCSRRAFITRHEFLTYSHMCCVS